MTTVAVITDSLREQHLALTRAAGFADVSDRTQIEVTGKDRAPLLHGLCTNHVKALQPGQGCEAFFTNVQGKTIGYGYVFCTPDSLVIDSAPGLTAELLRNLDRFVIREDVRFIDRGGDWHAILCSGPNSLKTVKQWLNVDVPEQPLGNSQISWRGGQVRIRRVPFLGSNCLFFAIDRSIAESFQNELAAQGVRRCDSTAIETVRIEAGSPIYGRDVTADNLPQEVDRNATAISFTKGCYLGQETVARLDALGHVNRTLCGVKFTSPELPPAGTEIHLDGKFICKVTSVCWSVRLEASLALAYVRRGLNHIGSQFSTPWGQAEVIRLPLE